MNKETILLLNEIIRFDCDKDWKDLKISRKGFDILVQYLEYLQRRIDELEKYLRESE